jgi:hypothetical protein
LANTSLGMSAPAANLGPRFREDQRGEGEVEISYGWIAEGRAV